ncbi:thioesterase family protein [Isoptericola sp. NEAU-Y5]|uniref:Thioesterase family protein n=1 Tax=Isoptericola luteus TaxID=2879484 RepID=A0ABS7ZGM6_9MICO|nr:acyl-CoA thioesterase domain-containing protein [Isoptericola sp. NEAU-Y5]MCA5894181.1 thioesterase family protein [Isoptericola sp. NEAU-Y5]
MAYFRRTGATTFQPTPLVGGAWKTDEQHVAPTLGLLAHLVEADRQARGRDDLAPLRLSYDIWGPYRLEEMETAVRVVRPGRGVELVEAEVSCSGRKVVTLRAWLGQVGDTTALAGGGPAPLPGPDETPAWDPTTDWPGGLVASIEVRRTLEAPGRGVVWVRTAHPLVEDEEVGALARFAGLLDVANGMSVRSDPRDVAFPNLDLTAHLHRLPAGEWLGLDTTVTFGSAGAGLTSAVLHDVDGAFGTNAQSLVVRPLR